MKLEFNAVEVSADYNEYGILMIVFGSEENYLMIQHEENPDEQDIKLGMGTYHIERDDQSYGGYGGVKRWTLKDDSLLIELDEKGKKNMQLDALEVKFQINAASLDNLREKLKIALG